MNKEFMQEIQRINEQSGSSDFLKKAIENTSSLGDVLKNNLDEKIKAIAKQNDNTVQELTIKQKVGKRMDELRKQSGISITSLGWDSGIDPSYVGEVIKGERNISLVKLDILCTTLNTSLYDFFDDEMFEIEHRNCDAEYNCQLPECLVGNDCNRYIE